MRAQRLTAVLLLALLFAFPVYALFTGWLSPNQGAYDGGSENFLSVQFPEQFKQALFEFSYITGDEQAGDVYLTENGLYRNFPQPDEQLVERNTDLLTRFAQSGHAPTYILLIPTACAIKQDELNPFTPLYNQRTLIDQAYQQFMGNATVVDLYPVLYAGRDQYLYYRTQDELTGLGGYYVYNELVQRLGISERKVSLSDFELEYAETEYYGKLYQEVRYHPVQADTIAFYHYAAKPVELSLWHDWDGYGEASEQLYFPEKLSGEDKTDSILGGISPRMELWVQSVAYQETLLLFGDETVKSYLPFLAMNYAHITFIDLNAMTEETLKKLEPDKYTQILFACDTRTFSQADFSALSVLEQAK